MRVMGSSLSRFVVCVEGVIVDGRGVKLGLGGGNSFPLGIFIIAIPLKTEGVGRLRSSHGCTTSLGMMCSVFLVLFQF